MHGHLMIDEHGLQIARLFALPEDGRRAHPILPQIVNRRRSCLAAPSRSCKVALYINTDHDSRFARQQEKSRPMEDDNGKDDNRR